MTELERSRCPKCGDRMVTKTGPIGDFLGCSRFPDCRGTRSLGHRHPVVIPTSDQQALVSARLVDTMKFIVAVGGIGNAYGCLKAAAALLSTDATKPAKKGTDEPADGPPY